MNHPARGALGYLQLATTDLAASIAFYDAVLGWRGEQAYASFEAPGLIGQWTTDLTPSDAGPVPWFAVDDLYPTLARVSENGGTVRGAPVLDQGERWLVEINDPSGNRLGLVARADGQFADHADGPRRRGEQPVVPGAARARERPRRSPYERLLADGELVLQLHHEDTDHHHGPIGDVRQARGNGVLVWFGAVSDFDGVVERAEQLGADVVKAPHRNPPEGEGNGPGHREIWVKDPDGYVVAVASPDGEAWE